MGSSSPCITLNLAPIRPHLKGNHISRGVNLRAYAMRHELSLPPSLPLLCVRIKLRMRNAYRARMCVELKLKGLALSRHDDMRPNLIWGLHARS